MGGFGGFGGFGEFRGFGGFGEFGGLGSLGVYGLGFGAFGGLGSGPCRYNKVFQLGSGVAGTGFRAGARADLAPRGNPKP